MPMNELVSDAAQPSDSAVAASAAAAVTLDALSRDDPDRLQQIREAAYATAERRGFTPGHEQDDWLAAEREVDAARELKPASGTTA